MESKEILNEPFTQKPLKEALYSNQVGTMELFYCKNIVHKSSSIFKNHIKSQVQEDKNILSKLLQDLESNNPTASSKAREALCFYEQMYQELIKNSSYKSQTDAMNHVCFATELDKVDTPVPAEPDPK